MASPIRDLLREVEAKAKEWQADVVDMREKSSVNPPADTLEYAAKDLLKLVHQLRMSATRLTPEQYAALHGGSAQTVRRWCIRGELTARQTATGAWEIDADAVRRPRVRGHGSHGERRSA